METENVREQKKKIRFGKKNMDWGRRDNKK